MNPVRLMLYLLIGTLAMLVPIMIQGAWYGVDLKKRIPAAVLLTIAGTLGTLLLYFVENGEFGGISFFGAVFFVPVLFIPVARLLGMKYDVLMDLCAPAECVMLAVMKVQCLTTGCCGGVTFMLNGKPPFTFPSQPLELINGLILGLILLLLSRKEKYRGRLFPMYMVLYGVTRFVLNLFRKSPIVPALHMPIGNFWSLVSIVIGILWMIWIHNRSKRERAVI